MFTNLLFRDMYVVRISSLRLDKCKSTLVCNYSFSCVGRVHYKFILNLTLKFNQLVVIWYPA